MHGIILSLAVQTAWLLWNISDQIITWNVTCKILSFSP